ncbi:unnamed protein product [Cochlearia groenlandica]
MSQSIFNIKRFSPSINNIIVVRRYILVTKLSQRAYAIGSNQEKPPWTQYSVNGYYKPETIAKELDSNIVRNFKSGLRTMRGEELWWMLNPRTGYYMPDNFEKELDAVDLRSINCNKN